MLLETAQISKVKHVAMLDTTVKSASEPIGKLLAPTWLLVGGFKRHQAIRAAEFGDRIELNTYFNDLPPLT